MIALLLLALAQGKQIPGPSVAVGEADRAEIRMLLEAYPKDDAPDVAVVRKAVDWALRYDEFLDPRDVASAKSLLRRDPPKPRLAVHAYRSRIDDSLQPYGVVLPENWATGDAKKRRLDFWHHGRDEKLTELRFLASRKNAIAEFAPTDGFVVHLYGRFCNASKFAGEVDLFEALDDVRRRYPMDEDRLAVRGFSMGGASTWHFGTHHAGIFAAVAPGAGFAETPVYARMFADAVKPTEWEQKLWRWYDATGYALNLSNTTVVAYSGELDKQKQAADIMAEAMRKHGLELTHVIGPKTEHKYEAEAKKEVARLVDAAVAKGRDATPERVRFTTFTLRYPTMKWVTIGGMERHWERATIEAERKGGIVAVKAENVTSFRIDAPGYKQIDIDGQHVSGIGWFSKVDGKWEHRELEGVRKRPGLQGPIDDAFMDRFVFVTPSGPSMSDPLGAWVAREHREAVEAWRRTLRGDVRQVKDVDLGERDIAESHLVLWGDPSSNAVLGRIREKLPLLWGKHVTTKGGMYKGGDVALVLIAPNPLNPKRYVVLNSGFTWKENAAQSNSRHVPLLPDWAILRLDAPPGARMSQRVLEAGFFDESWR
jgi:dienelactone hydrolase